MFQWHFAEFKRDKKLKETPWDFGHCFCPVLQHVATSCRFYQENLFLESGRTCLYFPRDHVHLRACRCSRFGTAGAVSHESFQRGHGCQVYEWAHCCRPVAIPKHFEFWSQPQLREGPRSPIEFWFHWESLLHVTDPCVKRELLGEILP